MKKYTKEIAEIIAVITLSMIFGYGAEYIATNESLPFMIGMFTGIIAFMLIRLEIRIFTEEDE